MTVIELPDDETRVVVDGRYYARCPGCDDWLEVTPDQYVGVDCIYHSPGCGYDGWIGVRTCISGDPGWRAGEGIERRLEGEEDDS